MTNYVHKNDLPDGLDLGNSVAIDTETMGLNINRDRLCVLQISSGNGDAHLVKFDQNTYDAPNLRKLLSKKEVLKIFHFARFDIGVISHYLNVDLENVYCTKIASKLVRTYTDAHGLKSLCSELIGVEISKKQQSSDWGNTQMTQQQIDYAASDVLYLHQLKEKLEMMLKREDRFEDFQSCLNFLPTRVKLDLKGFPPSDIFSHH